MEFNPVTKEVLRIKRQWEKEVQNQEGTRLFRWLGHHPQLQLVDSFVNFQLSEESFGNHRFLKYVREFEDPGKHGQMLMADVEELMAICFEHYHQTNPHFPKWETKGHHHLKKGNDAAFFAENITEMFRYYELKDFENLVVVFAPSNISCPVKAYEQWMTDFLIRLRHPQIKVMVFDTPELQLYGNLKNNRSIQVQDLVPEVNISKMMAATIDHQTAKNKEKVPGLEVQKLILEAGDLFGQQEYNKAFDKTEIAMELARKHNVPEQQFSVHVIRFTFYRSLQKNKQALEELEWAIAAASDIPLLQIQGFMFKGGVYLAEKQAKSATEAFAAAILLAAEHGDSGMIIESYRLFAFSARKAKAHAQAWEAYENILNYAKQLPQEKVKRSTFGLLAKDMLEICSLYGTSPDELEHDFRTLIGDDWDQIKNSDQRASNSFT